MSHPNQPSDRWRRRVHALLAKAESTEFPEEAEALLAKAQELMTRHAIDDAMLSEGRDDSIASERLVVEAPYATAKSSLLAVVAHSNGCRVVISGGNGGGGQLCVLVGPAAGRSATMTMFTALSMHAARQMLSAEVPAGDTPRRFRHAFVLAFSARIAERLAAANALAERDAEAEAGRSVALVLVGRAKAVEEAVAAEFPNLRTVRRQASSGAGIRSGRAAADRAGLGTPLTADQRRGLPTG